MTPLELLNSLEANLGQLPAPVAGWLGSALRRYQAGVGLEVALGLAGSSARSYRDQAVREAADLLNPGASPWHQAETLRLSLLRTPVSDEPPADPLKLELWRIRNTGLPVPQSRRSIYRILVTDNGDDVLSVDRVNTSPDDTEK